jgi:hypothetical protein
MRGWIAGLGTLFVFGVLYLVFDRAVESIIFQPTPGAQLSPADLGISGEELRLTTADEVSIHAYYLPAPGAERALLFLHGNGGNASHRLPNADLMRQLDCSVLVLDYRGYGKSAGRATEAGVYLDARAALAYLTDTLRFPSERIVLFGRSLGGAIAVDLAQDRNLAGVILESTFSSAADIARLTGGRVLGSLTGKRFAPIDKIARVRAPLLFFHGDRDRIADPALGRRLFDAAPQPKQFETIVGAGHNDTFTVGGRAYFERIGAFLDSVAPPG